MQKLYLIPQCFTIIMLIKIYAFTLPFLYYVCNFDKISPPLLSYIYLLALQSHWIFFASLHYRSLWGVSLFWPSHISIRGWVIKEQWEHYIILITQPLIEIWLGQELFTKSAKACWYVVNLLLCFAKNDKKLFSILRNYFTNSLLPARKKEKVETGFKS